MNSQPASPEGAAAVAESVLSTAPDPARTVHLAGDKPKASSRPLPDEGPPADEIGGGILGADPMPAITDEQREEMSRGLLEVTAEFQAEHGAFTDEERAIARSRLSALS